eukprot:UN02575
MCQQAAILHVDR